MVSKGKDSSYRSVRSADWIKSKNPASPAVKREAEEDWGRELERSRNRKGGARSLQKTPGSAARLVEDVENTPRQLVIDAHADDVIVKAHALIACKDSAGGRIEVGFILQPDIEIFDLRRPVPRELHLDAAAHRPTPVSTRLREGSWQARRGVLERRPRRRPRWRLALGL